MSDTEPLTLPLDGVAGAAGPHASEAFGMLGNETRLAILLALWERHDPHGGDDAMAFSEIFERVDYDNPGNLSYHIEKLAGQFITQHEERGGYELRDSGLKLVQSVIAGAGVTDATQEPTRVDQPCPVCDGSTTVEYRDGLVIHACTECPGPNPTDSVPDGTLSVVPFDPAGVQDRSAEEIRAASMLAAMRQVQSLFDGLCPACSGTVDAWLDVCEDHTHDGQCEQCGSMHAAVARFQCRVCKNHSVSIPKALAMFHPQMAAFYANHGVSPRFHVQDFEHATRLRELIDDHEMTVESIDPPRVSVTATLDGDECRLEFDETVRVIDASR